MTPLLYMQLYHAGILLKYNSYYSAKLVSFPQICYFCGLPDGLVNDDPISSNTQLFDQFISCADLVGKGLPLGNLII